MDVGAFDELALHRRQILELAPHVGAEGVGAFRAVALADGNGIVAVILIDPRHGEMAVLHLHPLAHVDHLRAGTMLFQGVGKGAAVPQQLHVPIAENNNLIKIHFVDIECITKSSTNNSHKVRDFLVLE